MRRTAPTARTWLTAALAVVVTGGYLLVSGTLDPVLSQAIALAQSTGDSGTAGSGLAVGKVADWQYFDDRPEWSTVRGVPQVPGPADPVDPVRPSIAPPENPIHFVFTGPPPMPHYSLKPLSSCPQPRGPGHNEEHFLVTTGVGQATLTWWDLADPDATSYILTAEPDYVNVGDNSRTVVRPLPVSITITPPKTCQQMTATVTGLTSGRKYYFLLESTNLSPVSKLPYMTTRGQSSFVTIG